ncbi:FecR domain-containing protein [uncultured Aquimarina sp.]|uniref:FecR family protein n=1 Tax=uncultured Aquimarina sp. TaxID=575652 RepID=UPI00261F7C1B|nr:FecR domain-containing protein [uncultured Aquimarina sp.]
MEERELIKFIKGEINPEDKSDVLRWIGENPANQKRYNLLKATYIASTLDAEEDINKEKAYQQFYSRKVSTKRPFKYVAIAASIIIICIAGYTFNSSTGDNLIVTTVDFFGSDIKSIATNSGDQKTIILPDGSTVIMNAKSHLTYPKKFTDSIRTVTLIGEAFFDVKRDTTKPFIVHTDDIKIRVLGTSFNIKSYPSDEKVETTLVTGKVEVLKQKNETPVVLKPSQRAIYIKNKSSIEVDNVDSENIISWKQGKLIFNKTPLKQVVQDLKRKYSVEFIIQSDTLLQYKYTGEFDNLSLEEALEILKLSSPINYKHLNNKIMLESQ